MGARCGRCATLLPSSPGEATAGKTQFALRTLLTVQLPREDGGLAGSALWVYTEGDPPLKRLRELAAGVEGVCVWRESGVGASEARRRRARPRHRRAAPSLSDAATAADRVFLETAVDTPAALLSCLDRAEREGLFKERAEGDNGPPPVKLILIDSVAPLFRDAATHDAAGYGTRADALFACAAALKAVAAAHSVVVLAVNQVTDVMDSSPPPCHTAGLRLRSSGREVAPALGLAWASCVGTRLFLSRGIGARARRRVLQVVFAPHLPPSHVVATVRVQGLVGGEPPGEEEEKGGEARA